MPRQFRQDQYSPPPKRQDCTRHRSLQPLFFPLEFSPDTLVHKKRLERKVNRIYTVPRKFVFVNQNAPLWLCFLNKYNAKRSGDRAFFSEGLGRVVPSLLMVSLGQDGEWWGRERETMNGQNLQDFLLNNSSLTSKIIWQKRVSIQSIILIPRVLCWRM